MYEGLVVTGLLVSTLLVVVVAFLGTSCTDFRSDVLVLLLTALVTGGVLPVTPSAATLLDDISELGAVER